MGLFKSIGQFFTGGQGEYYTPGAYDNQTSRILDSDIATMSRGDVQKRLQDYAAGNLSLKDLMAQSDTAGSRAALAFDPLAAGKLASDQVQNDAILGQLYGSDSALSRALSEEKNLAGRGFSLQPEDYEAYGQASDEIARLFGQGESNLAQSLASRGLAQGGGGVVGAQFATLQGNKNEQLASQQRAIAQQRMQMNLQRLQNTRNYLGQLGSGAQSALEGQRAANLQGVQSRFGVMGDQANRKAQEYGMQEGLAQKSLQSKAENYQPGLFASIGRGISRGVESGVSNTVGRGTERLFGGGSK